MHQRTALTATVYTDEAAAYRRLNRPHESVAHGVGEYVRGQAHTNGMESFWSMLKRGYIGVYHHMSVKHLDRYVNDSRADTTPGRWTPSPKCVRRFAGWMASG